MAEKQAMPEYLERVIIEYAELKKKTAALSAMLSKEQPAFVSDTQWELLNEQVGYMSSYQIVLYQRITDSLRAL